MSLTTDDIVAICRPALDRAESAEARRAALARLGGEAAVDVWPPDPKSINLHDGTWLLISDAMHEARCSEVTIRRRIASENIAIQIGGVWWVNRARLLSGRRYPKSPDQI